MPSVHRSAGWKAQIFADDHRPPHVHIVSAGREIVVDIRAGDLLRGSPTDARSLADGRRWAEGNRDFLLSEWERIVERER